MTLRDRVVHRALDGTRVVCEGGFDFSAPFTSAVDVTMNGEVYELHSGVLEFAQATAELDGIVFDQEFAFQGGLLRLGGALVANSPRTLRDRMMVGAWKGRAHSIYAHLYNASTADMLSLLNAFLITEHEDGISITPRDSVAVKFKELPEVIKQIPSLGVVTITQLTPKVARRLPSWAGTPISPGELFLDSLSNGDPYFVLATSTALVTVVPDNQTIVNDVPRLLDGLKVQSVN